MTWRELIIVAVLAFLAGVAVAFIVVADRMGEQLGRAQGAACACSARGVCP